MFPVTMRLARNVLFATIGVVVSVAALSASALAATSSNQTAPETRPAINITSASATLKGWLGSEQPEPMAPEEGLQPVGPGGPKKPIAPSDPERLPASWYFEYAPGASCTGAGYVTTPENVAMLKGFDEVGVAVAGLQPSTEYTACLVNWHTVLPGVSFTTLSEVSEPTAKGSESTTKGSEPKAMVGSSDNPLLSSLSVPAVDGASQSKVTDKALLTRALKACQKRPKRQRTSCDKRARKRYAAPQQ